MDYMVIAAERHGTKQEAENESACYAAAHSAGKTTSEADKCDSGDLQCPSCPWIDWQSHNAERRRAADEL